jgi:hypothetical protein
MSGMGNLFIVWCQNYSSKNEKRSANLRYSTELNDTFSASLSLYLFIYLSVALQPFCWTSVTFFSILIFLHGGTPWKVDEPVARPLPTQDNRQNKRTQTSMP